MMKNMKLLFIVIVAASQLLTAAQQSAKSLKANARCFQPRSYQTQSASTEADTASIAQLLGKLSDYPSSSFLDYDLDIGKKIHDVALANNKLLAALHAKADNNCHSIIELHRKMDSLNGLLQLLASAILPPPRPQSPPHLDLAAPAVDSSVVLEPVFPQASKHHATQPLESSAAENSSIPQTAPNPVATATPALVASAANKKKSAGKKEEKAPAIPQSHPGSQPPGASSRPSFRAAYLTRPIIKPPHL